MISRTSRGPAADRGSIARYTLGTPISRGTEVALVDTASMSTGAEPAGGTPRAGARGHIEALPGVATPLTPAEVRERLAMASRRGRMPGYTGNLPNGTLFHVCAFGHPFDGRLIARVVREDPATRLGFQWRMPRRGPAIFAAALVLTVWPGSYFMDQAMIQLLPGVRELVATGTWYVPTSAISGVWAWIAVMRRTRRSVAESARRLVDRIAAEIDGTVESG